MPDSSRERSARENLALHHFLPEAFRQALVDAWLAAGPDEECPALHRTLGCLKDVEARLGQSAMSLFRYPAHGELGIVVDLDARIQFEELRRRVENRVLRDALPAMFRQSLVDLWFAENPDEEGPARSKALQSLKDVEAQLAERALGCDPQAAEEGGP